MTENAGAVSTDRDTNLSQPIAFPPDWTVAKPSGEGIVLFWWFVQAVVALVGCGVARFLGVL